MSDTNTITSVNPIEGKPSMFNSAPIKQTVFNNPTLRSQSIGYDWTEFPEIESQSIPQKAQSSNLSGSVDLKQATSEAFADLAKASKKTAEIIGSGAQEITTASTALFMNIIGAGEHFSYTTTEQSQVTVNSQTAETQKKQAEKAQEYHRIRAQEITLEAGIQEVTLAKLHADIMRILDNGAAAMSEAQKRTRLHIQAGYTGKLEVYHITELRSARCQDEQSAKQDAIEQSMRQHDRDTGLDLNKAAEGGSQLSMASGQAAG
ncbi:hypothetical protein A3H85_00485 [Candidatus Daviesbacteria bacterium RIFCSPLOWO2_02_FULL_40_8]|nr:MAG: hypothetical protein A2780_03805 [Candidatus Daviesbacteria bacterium RIFCSPHIGHO2_01_FULL_41_45]OGE66035.1 MAG: hypothetical protein A3H85_00485 [Candidatus Daviesbacteria bacterium RIFCSPLOWO2_02_FULL_40_8]OGH81830.1 MAG: hypothetical protein A3F93_03930 [Candidatus Magasanikbacteria bacterium RIFCSPLOWO2_12_FULL_34_7]